MVLVNEADDIKMGTVQVLEVYQGTVKVWPWTAPVPSAITGTSGTASGPMSVTVSWTASPEATFGYNVYRNGVLVGWVPPDQTSLTNTGLTPDTAYIYQVAAVSGDGVGALGNQASVRTQHFPAPTGVQGTPAAGSATLSWNPVPDAVSYNIYRNGAHVGSTTRTTYTDTNLAAASTYGYQVQAVTGGGAVGDKSSTVNVAVPPPAAPAGLSGTSPSTSSVRLTWGASTGAASYIIWCDNVNVGTATGLTFTDTGLAAGSSHGYQVQAVATNGTAGPKSPTVTVSVSVPATPVIALAASTTRAEVYFTSITFTATAPTNPTAGTYTLQRQLPDQGWANVATMTVGVGLAVAHAIPAGEYTIGIFGTSAAFRVHFVGGGFDVYSPVVNVGFNYAYRDESFTVTLRQAAATNPPLFIDTWYHASDRVELVVAQSIAPFVASATFHVEDSEGYYCTGDVSNPYIPALSVAANPAQTGGGPQGPVGLAWGGDGWMYANNTLADFSPFGWRLAGQTNVPTETWGIGVNSLLRATLTITYVDGYRAHTWQVNPTYLNPRILIG
jgi:chitodextrinase